MITCQEVIEDLMAYINNELSVESRAAIDAHLAVCPECIRFLQTYQHTLSCESAAFKLDAPAIDEAIPESLAKAILAARAKRTE